MQVKELECKTFNTYQFSTFGSSEPDFPGSHPFGSTLTEARLTVKF
jgi:hypothetical protein